MPLARDAALRALLRFVAAALVLGTVAAALQDRLVGAAVPLFRVWLGWVDATYRTIDLSVADLNSEAVVQRIATPAHPHAVGDRVVDADPRTRLSTQAAAGIVLQPFVLAASLLIAWPWRRRGEVALRYAIAAPLMLLVVLLDVPMILYGTAWYQEVSLLDPDRFSPIVVWADFMNAGGRFALTVACCVVSMVAAANLAGRPTRAA